MEPRRLQSTQREFPKLLLISVVFVISVVTYPPRQGLCFMGYASPAATANGKEFYRGLPGVLN